MFTLGVNHTHNIVYMGDLKNNASISLINVYRLSKADLYLKLILRYAINVFSCIMPSFTA